MMRNWKQVYDILNTIFKYKSFQVSFQLFALRLYVFVKQYLSRRIQFILITTQ